MTNIINNSTMRSDTTDRTCSVSRSPGEAPCGAKERFDRALSTDEGADSSHQEDERGKRDEDGNAPDMPSVNSLFSSLFEGKMVATAASAAASALASADVGELVDTLAQRILVSDPQAGAPAEIRIQLNESVLADTQIVLSRGLDGLLHVQLLTGNVASMQTLVAARQSLVEQLEMQGPVMVKVGNTRENGQGDNDTNRRSQGFIEYDPENI